MLAGALAFLLIAPTVFAQSGYQRVQQRPAAEVQQVQRAEVQAMPAERMDTMEERPPMQREPINATEPDIMFDGRQNMETEMRVMGTRARIELTAEQRAAIEERRAERTTTLEAKRAEIEARKEARVAVLSEERQDRIQNVAGNAATRLEAGVAKVADAITKLETRANELADNGVDVSVSLGLLADAEASLSEASVIIEGLDVEITYTTTSDTPSADWEAAKAQFTEARDLIKAAADLTRQAVAEMKTAASADAAVRQDASVSN